MGASSERIGRVDAASAYEALQADPGARLIDVRTRAEWSFVGVPSLDALGKPLWALEWKSFPDMAPNPGFFQTLEALIDEERQSGAPVTALLFMCRSGARSMDAAMGAAARPAFERLALTNVSDGFEGDLDADGRRSQINGWKAAGLPWRQS